MANEAIARLLIGLAAVQLPQAGELLAKSMKDRVVLIHRGSPSQLFSLGGALLRGAAGALPDGLLWIAVFLDRDIPGSGSPWMVAPAGWAHQKP